jgi:hypothetical protein
MSRHRRNRSPPNKATVDHKFHQLRHRCSQANGRAASTTCCEFNERSSVASSGRWTIAGRSKAAVGETVIRFFREVGCTGAERNRTDRPKSRRCGTKGRCSSSGVSGGESSRNSRFQSIAVLRTKTAQDCPRVDHRAQRVATIRRCAGCPAIKAFFISMRLEAVRN